MNKMMMRTLRSLQRYTYFSFPNESFKLTKYPPHDLQAPMKVKSRITAHISARRMSTFVTKRDTTSNKTLAARGDEFGGVTVEMQEPMDSELFASLLRSSLSQWTLQGKKGVWIKLPIEHANLVEAAVQEGFQYHHAEPRYVMLTKWIPLNEPNTLPANASHRVGVGAFVINQKKEVLVVQEKKGMLKGLGVWKFPTGMINEGEDICAAAVREVKEETGIDTRFVELLTFRESHHAFFQKSDLLFICLLEPLSFDIQEQESEIEAAQWMAFEEYVAQSFVQRYDLLKHTTRICRARIDGQYSGLSAVPMKASFRDGRDYIYLNNQPVKA